MKLALSRETRALEYRCRKEAEKLPFEWFPVSYFANVGFIRDWPIGEKCEISENDVKNAVNMFPKESHDFDILVVQGYPGIEQILVESGYKSAHLKERLKIEQKKSGRKVLSPYTKYTRTDDRPIDVFIGRIGAIEVKDDFEESLVVNSIYSALQPGTIEERRIKQYVPVYVLSRSSGILDYEECRNKCKEMFSQAFKDRKHAHSPTAKFIAYEGDIKVSEAKYNMFLGYAKGEANRLRNHYLPLCLKRFEGQEAKSYCREALGMLIEAFDQNLPNA